MSLMKVQVGICFLLGAFQLGFANGIDCGLYNQIQITDPPGDASVGAPAYVDILGLKIRQIGDKVQLEWLSNGNPLNADLMYFFIFLDTDFNVGTGQNWRGMVGAEVKIIVSGGIRVHRFNAAGDWIADEEGPAVVFSDSGFVFNIEKSRLQADHFNLYFESSGFPPWVDQGSVQEIQLQTAQPSIDAVLESDHSVLAANPRLANIPDKITGVQLSTYLVQGGSATLIPNTDVSYGVYHPASHVISDPEAIISIDAGGVAHYNSEGYVFAVATVDACQLTSDPVILATGDVYGEADIDDVIAVWPPDYTPAGSGFSFGHMMSTYPNYIHTVNVAYRITADLYRGFEPFGGDSQIFALMDIPGHCGGAGNPLETAPCCYINCGDGTPQYNAVIHEMGHNFHDAPGMTSFLGANGSRFGGNFAYECIASLPVNYMSREFFLNGQQYDLGPGTYTWEYFSQFAEDDNFEILEVFEDYIDTGQSTGYFDMEGLYDYFEIISLFCSFFQAYVFEYEDYRSPHDHDMIRRFLNVWDGSVIPHFQEEKIETYFAASFCAAVGKDVRDKLRYWGFDIDDEFFDQIMPLIESRIELFADRFEFGNLKKWSAMRP